MEHSPRTARRRLSALTLAFGLVPMAPMAQQVESPDFTIENAVLDTSILFVTGAQEAVQELRGAFGWPTFQEGVADGIYYRFDPDGYARFAPTDRLDTNVFEVICRSRTVTCTAHKGILGIVPTDSGRFQLEIADLVEGEQFFLIEGTTEIQLPDQILQPMDARIESLLSSNGDLVIRRGADERARVSLVGLGQTVAYLRWVAARQDYSVLPRDWPVPSGGTPAPAGLTAPDAWGNPAVLAAQRATVLPAAAATPAPLSTDPAESAEIEALRREVDSLRSLLAPVAPVAPVAPEPAAPLTLTATTAPAFVATAGAAPEVVDAARISALETMVAALSAGLASGVPCGADAAQPCPPPLVATEPYSLVAPGQAELLDPLRFAVPGAPETPPMPVANVPAPPPVVAARPGASLPVPPLTPDAQTDLDTQTDHDKRLAQINYLMTDIGLDSQTALMVLELGPLGPAGMIADDTTCRNSSLDLAFADEMTRQALTDLGAPLPEPQAAAVALPEPVTLAEAGPRSRLSAVVRLSQDDPATGRAGLALLGRPLAPTLVRAAPRAELVQASAPGSVHRR